MRRQIAALQYSEQTNADFWPQFGRANVIKKSRARRPYLTSMQRSRRVLSVGAPSMTPL